jgi:hypothetical protein
MRCLNRLVLFFLFTTALSGVVASAQMPSTAVPDEMMRISGAQYESLPYVSLRWKRNCTWIALR